MSLNKNKFIKNFAASLAIIWLAATALLTVNAQSPKEDSKHTDYIEVVGKVLSIDPIKGDVTTRLEFVPHGNFALEDLSLTKNIKFDTVSANGKQEVTFEKGKRMSPSEVVLNMYDGQASDYPFDSYKADLLFFFTVKPDKEKPADKPKPAGENSEGEPKPDEPPADEEEETEVEVPFTLDFTATSPGYTITTAKSTDSDDTFIDLELTIVRGRQILLGFRNDFDDRFVARRFDDDFYHYRQRTQNRTGDVFLYRHLAFRFCRCQKQSARRAADWHYR